MKIIYLICLSLVTNLAMAEYCPPSFNCKKTINKKTRTIDLTCTLPAMPTFPITAVNVINEDGTLKLYWGGKDICNVLEWMDGEVAYLGKNYVGLNEAVDHALMLEIKHMQKSVGGMI